MTSSLRSWKLTSRSRQCAGTGSPGAPHGCAGTGSPGAPQECAGTGTSGAPRRAAGGSSGTPRCTGAGAPWAAAWAAA